jgi:hypothetical protein
MRRESLETSNEDNTVCTMRSRRSRTRTRSGPLGSRA